MELLVGRTLQLAVQLVDNPPADICQRYLMTLRDAVYHQMAASSVIAALRDGVYPRKRPS